MDLHTSGGLAVECRSRIEFNAPLEVPWPLQAPWKRGEGSENSRSWIYPPRIIQNTQIGVRLDHNILRVTTVTLESSRKRMHPSREAFRTSDCAWCPKSSFTAVIIATVFRPHDTPSTGMVLERSYRGLSSLLDGKADIRVHVISADCADRWLLCLDQ